MIKFAVGVSSLALGLALLAAPAMAQRHMPPPAHSGGGWTHGNWHGGPHAWRGGPHNGFAAHTFAARDFAHFTPADRHAWVGGHWWHGPWHGRNGWWWFAAGSWYFYSAPIYPYPLYVSDYYVGDDYYDYPDDSGAAPGYSWYYCKSPPGYYPYVQNCASQWQPVPAGAPPGYQSGMENQGPPPGYSDEGPDDQDGPPPGYSQGGPNGSPPPPPPNGH